MRRFSEFAVFPCCALVALIAMTMTPTDPLYDDPMEAYERQLELTGHLSAVPGPLRDFGKLGPERWALAGIAVAGVLWIALRRREAARGLFRLSLLSVLSGVVAAAQGSARNLTWCLEGGPFQYEYVARSLSGIRLGFGLAALLVLASLVLEVFKPTGGEA